MWGPPGPLCGEGRLRASPQHDSGPSASWEAGQPCSWGDSEQRLGCHAWWPTGAPADPAKTGPTSAEAAREAASLGPGAPELPTILSSTVAAAARPWPLPFPDGQVSGSWSASPLSLRSSSSGQRGCLASWGFRARPSGTVGAGSCPAPGAGFRAGHHVGSTLSPGAVLGPRG